MKHIDPATIEMLKNRLETELQALTETMQQHGHGTINAGEWTGASNTLATDSADRSEVADQIEELVGNVSAVRQLEAKYHQVTSALARIKDGTYGICSVGGEAIDTARLEANPTADTCLKHAHQ